MTAHALFDIGPGDRPRRELTPGAVHVPSWLTAEHQRWIVGRFHEWTRGPVPIRAAKVRGYEMSVQTVCLGWHWQPYKYTREATDINGKRVLPFPGWMVHLGRLALAAAADDPHAGDGYTPDAALINYYDREARLGMHQDKDERAAAPVVSLSIGDRRRDASPVLQGGVSPGPSFRPGAVAALLLDDRQRSAAARGGGNLVRAARVFSVDCRHRVR